MKYMLLIHQGDSPTPRDPEAWATLSEDEQQEIYAAYMAINKTPGVTPGNGLQPPETATTVRFHGGKPMLIDGPFIEAKEIIGGFALVDVADLDEALEMAKSWPGGNVEVRPVVDH